MVKESRRINKTYTGFRTHVTFNNTGICLTINIGDPKVGNTDEISLSTSGTKQFIPKEKENPKNRETIFVLCDSCFWSATFFGNLMLHGVKCPNCRNTELSSFPILANESFVLNHGGKRGIELIFSPRIQSGH